MSKAKSSLIGSGSLVALLLTAIPCWGSPAVEGFDQASVVRTGRTTFDYTYTLRVQVDGRSYTDASYTVTSASAATKVIQGSVPLGNIDAASFIRSKSTFAIQQDRTVPFDPTALHFTFSGSVIGASSSSSNVHIGTVDFLVDAGRPLHRGSFPMQTVNPVAGATLGLRADVFGSVSSVSFEFVSLTNQPLASGPMSMSPSSLGTVPRYLVGVRVPTQPFHILITALDANGVKTAWTSATVYRPSPLNIALAPAAAEVARGTTIATQIRVSSITASGPYTVALLLPSGWTTSAGPWSVTLVPGKVSTLQTTLTPPATGQPYSSYTLTALVSPVGNAFGQQAANQQFVIE